MIPETLDTSTNVDEARIIVNALPSEDCWNGEASAAASVASVKVSGEECDQVESVCEWLCTHTLTHTHTYVWWLGSNVTGILWRSSPKSECLVDIRVPLMEINVVFCSRQRAANNRPQLLEVGLAHFDVYLMKRHCTGQVINLFRQ